MIFQDQIELPGLLLVSGTGRNSGKTTLVCDLITMHRELHCITAIKIAPHAHHIGSSDEILVQNNHFQIIRETKTNTGKDSSLMLKAGAQEVYYVQAEDKNLQAAFQFLLTMLSPKNIYICESGGLRKYCKPDLFLIIHNDENSTVKESSRQLLPHADKYIKRNGSRLDFDLKRVIIQEGCWTIQ